MKYDIMIINYSFSVSIKLLFNYNSANLNYCLFLIIFIYSFFFIFYNNFIHFGINSETSHYSHTKSTVCLKIYTITKYTSKYSSTPFLNSLIPSNDTPPFHFNHVKIFSDLSVNHITFTTNIRLSRHICKKKSLLGTFSFCLSHQHF